MKHRKLKRKVRRTIEITVVAAVTAALFIICRKLGIEQRGSTLLGGEMLIPVMVPAMYAAIKSITRDIKEGLFR